MWLAAGSMIALAQPLTQEEFRAQLDQVREALDQNQPLAELPTEWQINTDQGRATISTEPLRNLGDEEADRSAALLWLEELQALVDSPTTVARNRGPREALDEILADEEFDGLRPPSELQQLRNRFGRWLGDLIAAILNFAAQNPTGTSILFWTLVAAGILFVATWLLRLWTAKDPEFRFRSDIIETHEGKGWREWMAAARLAATGNHHAEAIRCGYWAGISKLQEDRILPAQLCKTPRESLEVARSKPASDAVVASLSVLTQSFEQFWYGKGQPGPEQVEDSFHRLETLGCGRE